MNKIYYVDALAGAGKTYETINRAIKLSNNNKRVVIIQPSIKLLEQTKQNIIKLSNTSNVILINNKTINGSVRYALSKITQYAKSNTILLITHSAYSYLKPDDWTNKHKWICFWDELIEPVIDLTLKVSNSAISILKDYSFIDSQYDNYNEIIVDTSKLKETSIMVHNPNGDKVLALSQYIAQMIVNVNYKVYISNQAISDLSNKSNKHLYLYAVIQPSYFQGFHSIYLISALLKQSSLYKILSNNKNIKLIDRTYNNLRFTQHTNPINFYYWSDHRWSKNYYNTKIDSNNKTVMDNYISDILKLFGDETFTYQSNKSFKEFDTNSKAILIDHLSQGLNEFDIYHNYVSLGAFNGNTRFNKFCRSIGLEDNDTNRLLHLTYQGIMRLSHRNPNIKETIKVILPSKNIYELLSDYFENAAGCYLNLSPRTILPSNMLIINSKSENKLTKKIYNKVKYNETLDIIYLFKQCSTFTISIKSLNYISSYKTSYYSSLLLEERFNINSHIRTPSRVSESNLTSKTSEYIIPSKEDAILLSPALYQSTTKKGGKAKDIIHLTSLWFDIDDDKTKPHIWRRILGNNIKIIMYNTYNSTSTNKKYRVIIPINKPIKNKDYKLVTLYLNKLITDMGYPGVDTSCCTPHRFYHAPCISKNNDYTFNIEDGEEILDIDNMIAKITTNSIPKKQYKINNNNMKPCNITKANNILSQVGVGDQTRYMNCFSIGANLQGAPKETILLYDNKLRQRGCDNEDIRNYYNAINQ